jgi:hypothetical protein
MMCGIDSAPEKMIRRGEQELHGDVQLVVAYGRAHPDAYGGIRLEPEDFPPGPVRLVAAFSANLQDHLVALRSIVEHPRRLDVRSCTFSKKDADLLGDRVQDRILSVLPDIGNLVVLSSVWSGVLVLVKNEDIVQVGEVIGDEPWVRVDEGGYEPGTG